MKTMTYQAIDGFSTLKMKQELQERFQKKTEGMSVWELQCLLGESLEPLPQIEIRTPYEVIHDV